MKQIDDRNDEDREALAMVRRWALRVFILWLAWVLLKECPGYLQRHGVERQGPTVAVT